MTTPDPALVAAHVARVHRPQHLVTVTWDGVTWTDESAFVVAMRGVESVDSKLGQINTSEVNVTLDNSTDRYTPSNASSPIYAHLTRAGQATRVSLGYDGALAQIGTFWIDDMIANDRDGTVDMRLLDRGAWLDGRNVNVGPVGSIRTDNVIRLICDQLGLTEGVDYVCDVGDTICQYAAAVNAPAFGELQAVAFAEGGRVFVDPDGVIRFLSRTSHRALLAQPKASFRRSEVAYEAARPRAREGGANRIVLEYEDRDSAIADEVVYEQVTPLGVGSASSWTQTRWAMVEDPPGTFNLAPVETITVFAPGVVRITVRGMDRTRWERSLPLIFTNVVAITANTTADGSGTNVTVTPGAPSAALTGFSNTLRYEWVPNGPTGTLTFWNESNTPVHVRVLRINGRPARTVSPFAVTVDDVEAQVDGIVSATIRNAYLPSSDVATERARDWLFFRSGRRARVDPQMDGTPYLRPLDTFAFIDDSMAPEVTEYLQLLRNDWAYGENGYVCTLRTAPALPPTDKLLAESVAAPIDGALVIATDSGPWHWANPFFTGDVKDASTPFPWIAEAPTHFTNVAPLSTSTDVPAGNPTPFSARFGFTGVFDQVGIVHLPAPLTIGTTYTVRFWVKRLTGSGDVHWIVGSKSDTSGGPRATSWGQAITTSWVQRSISFTPSGSDCADPMLLFKGWGGIISDVVVAGVTVEHGTPGKALVWNWSEWA